MEKVNREIIRDRTIQERDQRIDEFLITMCAILAKNNINDQQANKISCMNVQQIIEQLNSGRLTSLILVAVYAINAGTMGRKLCAITDQNFGFALKMASQCDKHRKYSGNTNWTFQEEWDPSNHLWPLYGIPISVKDVFDVKGVPSTSGLTRNCNFIPDKDSTIVEVLKKSGVIPFVKTNVPPLCWNIQTECFLWGRCLNPWNISKSAGGSTGGQGSLIACGGSPLGMGKDAGGSLRVPAMFCGISTLKCSNHRFPSRGNTTACDYSQGIAGMDFLSSVDGPMARSVDALAYWMAQVTNPQLYSVQTDPYHKIIPFDGKKYIEAQKLHNRLRVGYFYDTQYLDSSPAARRAVKQTCQFLESQGHEIVPVYIPGERQLIEAFISEATSSDGMRLMVQALRGDPPIPQFDGIQSAISLPSSLNRILSQYYFKNDLRLSMLLHFNRRVSTHEYLNIMGRAYKARQEFVRYWRRLNLDFIICPGFASEALDHNFMQVGRFIQIFVFIWNMLGMTVCSVPVTRVKQEQQYYESRWEDDITRRMKESAKNSEGLPVGVQIVGVPFEEERVLGAAKVIEQKFSFWRKNVVPEI